MRIGLNPYGLSYTAGLQGAGARCANPQPIGIEGFVHLACDLDVSCIELDWRWLVSMTDADLSRLKERLGALTPICSFWLSQQPGETLKDAVRCTTAIGAHLLRLHLTPVLEGARARWGARWGEMLAHARTTLRRESSRVSDAGLVMGIENHQDLGSEELLDIVEELGDHAGIVLDTGNPFAVAEDPVEFTRRTAHRIRHVHFKDYVAQFTDEGFRLVRCPLGGGAVPFHEIAAVLERHSARTPSASESASPRGGRSANAPTADSSVTASIEPGALEARHIRLFTSEWWNGYPPRQARELVMLLERLRRTALAPDADYRTPWERGAAAEEISAYEMDHVRRSVDYFRAMGWM